MQFLKNSEAIQSLYKYTELGVIEFQVFFS